MMKIYRYLLVLMVCALPLVGCAQKVKDYRLQVVESLPHDTRAYTQGLFFHNGELYESCGQYGSSSFRKVELATGKDLKRLNFDAKYFVEGSCVHNGLLYILTWQEHKCFVYDIATWKFMGELYNPREGWGLTTNGKDLILSDGSTKIYFLDPQTFAVRSFKEVTIAGKPVPFINELEWINGEIWANVYTTDRVLIINPETGVVEGMIDFAGLLKDEDIDDNTDVFNGIAYDAATKRIFVTGKHWNKLFEVEIVKR